MSYAADPGNVFASDAHRRVMAHLPNPDDDPISVEDLIAERINKDPNTLAHFEAADEVAEVLAGPRGRRLRQETEGRLEEHPGRVRRPDRAAGRNGRNPSPGPYRPGPLVGERRRVRWT